MPKNQNAGDELKKLIQKFKNKKLSQEDRSLVITTLLESVNALPITDIISYDLTGTVRINGKELTSEQIIMLRDGARALQANWTYKVIKDQIAYEAIKMGVHKSTTIDMLIFSKAALWHAEQEKRLLDSLNPESVWHK